MGWPALQCLDITCLYILSFRLKDFSQTEQNQLVSTPQEQNVDWERGRMLSIYIGFQAIKFQCFLPLQPPPPPHFYCFPSTTTTTTFLLFSLHQHHRRHHISIVFFPPPPPPSPPHFYCFPSTTTTFLLFSLHHHHHHHISIVFPPPPPPPPPHFYCFPSTRFYKRLPTAILSSFCSNVSCSEQQSWFSSTVSWLPCLSAPVSFKDSYSTATTFTSPSLIQYNWNTFPFPKKISGYCCHIRTLYLTWPDRMSLTKQRSESLYKRVVVLLKMY